MADQDTSLPIRSEADGADARVHVKIVDGTTPAQQTTVDTDGNVHVEIHGDNPAGGDEVLRLSELGAPNGDGVYNGTNNTKPASSGVIAKTRSATDDETVQVERVTAVDGENNSTCMDVSIHDGAGNEIDAANPLPVYMTDDPADEIIDYNTVASLAVDAATQHDYLVSGGKTLTVKKAWASASGKIKVEVQKETAAASGIYNTLWTGFNSTSNPNVDIPLENLLSQVTGAIIRIEITNRDLAAQDVYSTLVGLER